jgi:hypothetical protein
MLGEYFPQMEGGALIYAILGLFFIIGILYIVIGRPKVRLEIPGDILRVFTENLQKGIAALNDALSKRDGILDVVKDVKVATTNLETSISGVKDSIHHEISDLRDNWQASHPPAFIENLTAGQKHLDDTLKKMGPRLHNLEQRAQTTFDSQMELTRRVDELRIEVHSTIDKSTNQFRQDLSTLGTEQEKLVQKVDDLGRNFKNLAAVTNVDTKSSDHIKEEIERQRSDIKDLRENVNTTADNVVKSESIDRLRQELRILVNEQKESVQQELEKKIKVLQEDHMTNLKRLADATSTNTTRSGEHEKRFQALSELYRTTVSKKEKSLDEFKGRVAGVEKEIKRLHTAYTELKSRSPTSEDPEPVLKTSTASEPRESGGGNIILRRPALALAGDNTGQESISETPPESEEPADGGKSGETDEKPGETADDKGSGEAASGGMIQISKHFDPNWQLDFKKYRRVRKERLDAPKSEDQKPGETDEKPGETADDKGFGEATSGGGLQSSKYSDPN